MNKFERITGKIVEQKKANTITFLITLVILTTFMVLYNRPLIVGHDYYHHLGRLEGLIQALKDGTFPWYINYNGLSGAGYFVKAFYCDATLLPFGIIGTFTNSMIAYYSLIVTSTLLCGISMYYCIYKVYKNLNAAFISSILYTFCAYRLLDVYTRAAIGEVFAFIFLPIIFWGMYEILKGDYKKWYILAIGYSLTIFSHSISSIISIIPILIFMGIHFKAFWNEPKRILYLSIAAIVTIILTSYYIFPMLEQMASNTFFYNVRGSIEEKRLNDILRFRMVLGGFIEGTMHGTQLVNYKVGALLTFGILVRIFVNGKSKMIKSADRLTIVGLVILFMITKAFPWKIFPFYLFSVMQFSWRLFMFPSLLLAISGAIYLTQAVKGVNRMVYTLLGITILTSIVIHIEKHNSVYDNDMYPTNYTYGSCEYLPSAVPSFRYLIERLDGKISKNDDRTLISNYENKKGIISFDVETKQDNIGIPMVYYKGYEAEINGTKIELKQNPLGLIELPINESGKVSVYYAGTTIQKVSTLVSLLAIISLCIFIYLDRNKRKNCNI